MALRGKVSRDLDDDLERQARKRYRYASPLLPNSPIPVPMDHDSDSHRHAVIGSNDLIQRNELIMLVEQSLAGLGFADVGEQLASESGVRYESASVSTFRRTVLEGDLTEALELLSALGLDDSGANKEASFFILEQVFLEALEKGDTASALRCLQKELATLGIRQERLHLLAGCMLCTTPLALRRHAGWTGTKGRKNRAQLLREVQAIFPPNIMVPESRLEVLLEQALKQQLATSRYHNAINMPVSLLTDYCCSREHIPSCTTQVLMEHTEEVWHVQFSHNGRWLASASRDASAVIWEVTPQRLLVKRHVLRGHTESLTFCCWSPDDGILATCSADCMVKLWDSETGACKRTLDHHSGVVTGAVWTSDGQRILTTSEDRRIVMFDLSDDSCHVWKGQGVNEIVLTRDGRALLTPFGENKVLAWDANFPESSEPETLLEETDCIVSMAISHDSRRLVLNMASRVNHLWSIPIKGSSKPTLPLLLGRLRGPKEKQSRFVVHSCFGGYDDSYVLSGSEECKVFVWHCASGELLAALEGHSGTVNAVSWNPVDHHMFASASDDKSIHIWGLDPNCTQPSGSPLIARVSSSPGLN